MPLFGKHFSLKGVSRRKTNSASAAEKAEQLALTDGVITLKLGDQELTFEKGEWISDTNQGGAMDKHYKQLIKKIRELEKENKMLKTKCSVMLDMLSQATTESQLKEKELERLRQEK